jgi:hypothetical protein
MTEEPGELLVGPPPQVEWELSPGLPRPLFHCRRESRSSSFLSLCPVVVMRPPVVWLLLLGWVPLCCTRWRRVRSSLQGMVHCLPVVCGCNFCSCGDGRLLDWCHWCDCFRCCFLCCHVCCTGFGICCTRGSFPFLCCCHAGCFLCCSFAWLLRCRFHCFDCCWHVGLGLPS